MVPPFSLPPPTIEPFMSSMIFVDCSPGANAPESEGSGDQADSPVRQTQTGRREKFCPDCEEWIGLGLKGSEHPFIMHQGGKRCRRVQRRRARKKAAEELEQYFGIHPSPTSPIVEAASSSTNKPPAHLPSHGSTHAKPHSLYFSPTTAPVIRPSLLPCGGIRYKWELGDVCKTYPFQYHATGVPTWAARIVPPVPDSDTIGLESHNCTGFRDPSMEACLPCMSIPNSREFKNVLRLASNDPTPDTPFIHLSLAQALKRLREVDDELQRVRLEVRWFSL